MALRIGQRCRSQVCDIKAQGEILEWADEAIYLGVYISSGYKFCCNAEKNKIKFYRAANCILSKLGNLDNAATSVHLITTIALPILTYSFEALLLNKTQLLDVERPWSRTFMKLFKTFDCSIVRQCQFYTGSLPIAYLYVLRKMSFLLNLEMSENSLLKELSYRNNRAEISLLADRFDCDTEWFKDNYRNIVFEHFNEDVIAGDHCAL